MPIAVTWALLLAGAAAAGASAVWLWRARLHTQEFLRIVEKLTSSGGYDRARALSRFGAPDAPVARITLAALELRLGAREIVFDRPVTFRSAPESRSIEDRAREALEPIAHAELRRARWSVGAAVAGLVLALGSLVPPRLGAPAYAAAAIVLVAVWALFAHRGLARGIALTVARVPAVVRSEDVMFAVLDAASSQPEAKPREASS